MNYVATNFAIETLYVIILTNILAWIFYSTFKLGWPDIYFSTNEKVALFVSTTSKRYLSFRIFPLLIIILFSVSVLMKEKPVHQLLNAGVLSGAVYSLSTDGLAIMKLILNNSSIKIFFNRSSQILLHIATIISFSFIGLVAGYISSFKASQNLTPTPQGLVDNVWSAILVAIGVVYITYIFKPKDMEIEQIFKKSRENIDKSILEEIKSKSKLYNANPLLVEAICIIENIQRPKWLRKFESTLGKIKQNGSYGIMQITTKKPMSDVESVDRSIQEFHRGTTYLINYKDLYEHIKKYNNSNEYIDLVIKAMEYLDSGSVKYE